ncbi:hypothetical protein PGTUg99_019817 [Puccinia graminis f. sp. tritici]|uniref:BHLH domain-containing protein n=1 Tax=Puccinia graminis f. sp. tritici TaxID=56615 RepID=A0A5B0NAF4_PUCGR|nr:hypothetical protein PGTUg99_019817 [Puccinia graminis f. sp. tritici]
MCFEDLRHILPPIQWNEKEEGQAQERRPGEGNVGGQRSVNAFDPLNPNKGMSKVALLRRSNEYILRLKERLKRRDGAIEMLVKMLADHQLGTMPKDGAPKPQETEEPGPSGSPSRPNKTHEQQSSKGSDPLQALEDSLTKHPHPHHQQAMLDDLRQILGQIRLEKQEDKDDHRIHQHHQIHHDPSRVYLYQI